MKYSGYFSCFFKGENCLDYGLLIKKRPNVPAPQRRITAVRIAGRDGELVIDDEIYDSIVIPVELNFMAPKPEAFAEIFRQAKLWLRGSGTLSFSDDPNWFYKCQYVVIEDTERTSRRLGNFVAEFHCEPYMYALTGLQAVNPTDSGGVIANPFLTSHPVYHITGSGSGTLTVNGKDITFTSPGQMMIDTERMMAANPVNGANLGTALTGYYSDLYLQPGANQISVSSGFLVSIVPAWRTL